MPPPLCPPFQFNWYKSGCAVCSLTLRNHAVGGDLTLKAKVRLAKAVNVTYHTSTTHHTKPPARQLGAAG